MDYPTTLFNRSLVLCACLVLLATGAACQVDDGVTTTTGTTHRVDAAVTPDADDAGVAYDAHDALTRDVAAQDAAPPAPDSGVAQDSGAARDAATAPDTTPPPSPTCDADAHTGYYCGSDKVSDGRRDTLYECNGPGPVQSAKRCKNGCKIAASGHDDYCKPPSCDANASTGYYCGGDKVSGGDTDTLYECAGPGPIQSKMTCADGCVVAPSGQDDYCRGGNSYRLPWSHRISMQLTQDCNDSCCNDHVGNAKWAWDWANGNHFLVRAARAGTITHMKLSSSSGGASSYYSHYVNMIVVDHGDGTQAIYMHLKHDSASTGIHCGAHVSQGQPLALAGTTGHSTGVHLHFQVDRVHHGVAQCECGRSGLGCAADFNPFPAVWPSSTYPSVPINFEEWPAASCSNRRGTMPQSLN